VQISDETLMGLTMTLTHVARSYKAAADKMAANFGLSHATAWPIVMIGMTIRATAAPRRCT
jgi:MarR family transcriptional regulator for hemolysin